MKKLLTSNTPYYDKSADEWIKNETFKASSWEDIGFTEGFGLDFFKEKLDNLPIKDFLLSKEQILLLKEMLENKINELLIDRKSEQHGRPTIIFLGKEIKLNIVGENLQDNVINKLFKAYQVCEECLEENKPLYLSITEEE
ncbi:hypothetical protein NAT51_01560 [Flavobacterium amniphilum]|uniref:hypothetical protein n=1 Tax=Flavobacterium amniphilum TaxID=1834035 RepID=UPI00202A5AD7|nr:hypothetical protein [Flavobacterium amniphilum]MCL9804193.1 hypothetical protein [Flavobacterium amniphilum]